LFAFALKHISYIFTKDLFETFSSKLTKTGLTRLDNVSSMNGRY
jgi:hypothetical protein